MKVALCVIGRLENQYAVEFVEWYKNLGFDKIFIYDNNHDGEEHFEDVLQQQINDGFVGVVDFRNKEVAQLKAYNDCYSKYNKEFDWIAFFDFDEFLVLKKDANIKDFLSKKEEFQCVKINWMMYTDNNLILNDGRPVNERFTKPADLDIKKSYSFPENNHVKSIIKCGIKKFKWSGNPHVCGMGLKCCDANGNKSSNSPFQPYNFESAYLKHFSMKTIDEYVNNKIKRGVADRSYSSFKETYKIEDFFRLNEKTREKEDYLKFLFRKENLTIFICAHKPFEQKVSSPVYEVINSKDIHPKLPLNNEFYSELYHYKYVADNIPLKKYVGFCHYRRYFSFLDNIPDMDEIFKTSEAIVAKPIIYRSSVKQQYANCHNIEDLYIIGGIIADKYPEDVKMWHSFINGKIFLPYNMFIMRSEDFKDYAAYIHNILGEYLKIVGTDIKKRIENNKEMYLKDFSPNDGPNYQYRIGGYLAERLTNLFIMTRFKKLKAYSVVVTENKYRNNEKTDQD